MQYQKVEGENKKSAQTHKLAIDKKSTIIVQSSWNLVKIFMAWVLYVAKILA